MYDRCVKVSGTAHGGSPLLSSLAAPALQVVVKDFRDRLLEGDGRRMLDSTTFRTRGLEWCVDAYVLFNMWLCEQP